MKVLNSSQMREIDRKAIEEMGIIGPVLMENAGIQVFRTLLSRFPEVRKEKVVIVAGKGNNGGDGFVVARHLFNIGCKLDVLLIGTEKELKGDAALNCGIARKIGVDITEASTRALWESQKDKLYQATIVVDALFGTGLTKPAAGLYAHVIDDINKSTAFKISVDIPSGLSSDTHLIIGPCVKADLTVSLAAPKIAHVFPPAEEYVGQLVVAEISIPPFLFDYQNLKLEMVERESLLPFFQRRKKDTHKGTYGHLFVISGSLGKTGAAIMAARAALRMGAGLVTVGTPRTCLPIVARSTVELMTEALEETEEKTIALGALQRALSLLEGKDALLIGPGISTHRSTSEFVVSLLPRVKVPLIVDADGLNIIAENPAVLSSLPRPAVLTPHPGEFARLVRLPTKEVLAKRIELVPEFSQKYGLYCVFKGYRTLVSSPDGRVFINPTGNPGMASAGVGDVLSGMIASMVMQEKKTLEAVLAAVYIHGLSGDIAAQRVGERPLTASNIITSLPRAIKSMEEAEY